VAPAFAPAFAPLCLSVNDPSFFTLGYEMAFFPDCKQDPCFLDVLAEALQ
jgi:hypothetical protein